MPNVQKLIKMCVYVQHITHVVTLNMYDWRREQILLRFKYSTQFKHSEENNGDGFA